MKRILNRCHTPAERAKLNVRKGTKKFGTDKHRRGNGLKSEVLRFKTNIFDKGQIFGRKLLCIFMFF